MKITPPRADDEYSYPLHMQGAAHSVSGDTDVEDVVARLRAVVAEVTGRPCAAPAPPRMGFLP